MKIKHEISGYSFDHIVEIEWESHSGEVIERHDSGSWTGTVRGLDLYSRLWEGTGIYQDDELIDVEDIECLDV
jgi:hypothetical protein